MKHFTYVFLLVFTLSYPLYKSFEDKVAYYKKWKALFPAILISAAVFIAWDVWFTSIGVWKFNPEFVTGIYILNLPLEEWLFFLIVPFSCVFIYEVLNYFIKKSMPLQYVNAITYVLILYLLITAGLNPEKIYTLVAYTALALMLLIQRFILKSTYMGRYYIAWAVCLIPFLIVNGVLTAMPVLIYNNLENLGIRIYTIPLEDAFYGMLQFLLVITIYEYLKNKRK